MHYIQVAMILARSVASAGLKWLSPRTEGFLSHLILPEIWHHEMQYLMKGLSQEFKNNTLIFIIGYSNNLNGNV